MASQSENIECTICYSDIEEGSLTCPKCSTSVCIECSVTYFGYAAGDREIPKCTNNECGYTFLYKDLKRERVLLTAYLPCVSAYFLHSYQSEDVKEKLEIDAMIEKVRKDKMVFLVQNLPPAVALTAELCMGRRMVTVSKLQREKINSESKKATRPCMNISCRGKLNSDYVCNLCESSFCKECEIKIRGEHTCRQEDLDSVKEMKSSRTCPNCSVPIFKYSGCMMMTCPVCKYHFHYETGEQINFGNNHNADVTLKEERKLFLLYEKELTDLGLLEDVKKLEKMELKPYTTSKLTKLVVKLHDDPKNKVRLIKLAKEFSSFTIGDRKYKNYIKAIVEIEDLIVNKEFTPEKLSSIMEQFNDST